MFAMKQKAKVKVKEFFRVGFWKRAVVDCRTFEEAVRVIREAYPAVDYATTWHEMPPAGNGDRCSELPFGCVERQEQVGILYHVRLPRPRWVDWNPDAARPGHRQGEQP